MLIKIQNQEKSLLFNNFAARINDWQEVLVEQDDFVLIRCGFGVMALSEIENKNYIVASFTAKDSPFTFCFSDFNTIKNYSSNSIEFQDNSLLIVEDGTFLIDIKDNSVTVKSDSSEVKLEFIDEQNITSANISMSTAELVVNGISAVPSVSLGVFDYYPLGDSLCCMLPRPVRFGIPVISTVPVPTSTDIDENFLIPEEIKVMFRIAINENMPSSLDGVIRFQIYMPGGVDTVRAPINLPVVRVTNASQVGISDSAVKLTGTDITHTIYVCDHTFSREDSREFVDGFAYFNLFVPMRLYASISGFCTTD